MTIPLYSHVLSVVCIKYVLYVNGAISLLVFGCSSIWMEEHLSREGVKVVV